MAKAKHHLPALDPVTREQLAQWIEDVGKAFAIRAEEMRSKGASEPLNKYEIGQISYWDSAVGYGKWLAYRIRTAGLKKMTAPELPVG